MYTIIIVNIVYSSFIWVVISFNFSISRFVYISYFLLWKLNEENNSFSEFNIYSPYCPTHIFYHKNKK